MTARAQLLTIAVAALASWALVAAAAYGVGLAVGWLATRAAMAEVERVLVFHGYAVKGFSDTAHPDLGVIDALAPDGCREVMRAAWLARLAIKRMQPGHAADADWIAIGAAARVAHDTNRLDCLAEQRP